ARDGSTTVAAASNAGWRSEPCLRCDIFTLGHSLPVNDHDPGRDTPAASALIDGRAPGEHTIAHRPEVGAPLSILRWGQAPVGPAGGFETGEGGLGSPSGGDDGPRLLGRA